MSMARKFEGDERAEVHLELKRYFDLGVTSYSKLAGADGMAADLIGEDPTLATDHLSLVFGSRIERGDLVGPAIAKTAGTWCMFAAAGHFKQVLAAAHGAGISMDDPKVFLKGGLLSYRRWFMDPPLVELALSLGASHDVQVQPSSHGTSAPGPRDPLRVLARYILTAGAMPKDHAALGSIKLYVAAGAKVHDLEALLISVNKGFGAVERATVNALFVETTMRASIERANETSGAEPAASIAAPPARLRARV